MSIDVRTAVINAQNYLQSFGYDLPVIKRKSAIEIDYLDRYEREYKIIKVNAERAG